MYTGGDEAVPYEPETLEDRHVCLLHLEYRQMCLSAVKMIR